MTNFVVRSGREGRRWRSKAPVAGALPAAINVRGARYNNLQNVYVDVPLWRIVAVVGVSGSGKTSLAMGRQTVEPGLLWGTTRFTRLVSRGRSPASSLSGSDP